MAKERRIKEVLMHRMEQSMDYQANSFSLFQTAIGLENQVQARTDELTQVLRRLEASTAEMQRAKEVAEHANISKTRFLAAATHDLLQPLSAARLSNAALREEENADKQKLLSRHIDRSLDHIEDLLRSILDISKLDAGIVTPEFESVRASDIFDSIIEDFEPVAEAKGLELRVRYSECVMHTDRKLYWRIMQNLVSNAIRYTHSGGVLLTCHRIESRVRMSVVDTGIGIEAHQHELIFNEFQRCAPCTGENETSLGLGLSIVQRLIKALNHDLTFQSRSGVGSSFSVYSPCAFAEPSPRPAKEISAKHKSVYGLSGSIVLILENDANILEAMRNIVEHWGCKPLVAISVSEALSSIERNRVAPDIIVADYQLDNEQNGLDGIRLLRQHLKREVPALMITADDSEETSQLIDNAGITKLAKPVKPARLRALMAHLLA